MITGIAWDHRRCWGPLEASVEPYRRLTGEEVRWDRRSLYSFGEGDLGTYAGSYDLVIYDHPFVGDASSKGWLLDLSAFLTPSRRRASLADEVGASWRSYAYDGGVWGLPVDTAAQTAAWRADLLEKHGLAVPKSLDDLPAFADGRPARIGLWIGWPSVPTDLMCTLMSLAASIGLKPGHARRRLSFGGRCRNRRSVISRRWRSSAHPKSREWNPIRCLDHMAANDDVAYVPYLFNYVNYSSGIPARPDHLRRPPDRRERLPARTLLGGAGIGVSARSANPRAAFDYAMYLCSPDYQSTDYVILWRPAGQPHCVAVATTATLSPAASSATRSR